VSENPLVAQARQFLEDEGDEDVKLILSKVAEECTPAEAAAVLSEGLAHPSWTVRKVAAYFLIRTGREAFSFLRAILRKGNTDQVYWACYVLSQIELTGCPVLATVLDSKDRRHRACAINALAHRHASDAITHLIKALDDPAWSLRKQAADILMGRRDPDPVVERLKVEITNSSRNRVYWGVHILAGILGPRTLPIMMKLLPWKDDDLRYLVIVALARLRVEGIVALLVHYLGDPSPLIRETVMDLLAERGPEALAPVVELIRSNTPGSLESSLELLARISPEYFFPECQYLLATAPPEHKYTVLRVLGRVGSDPAITLLISLFEDPQWVIRKYASKELARLGDRVVPALVNAARGPSEEIQFWAIRTLGRLGRAAAQFLMEALRTGDRETRGFAIAALQEEGVPETFVGAFVELFADDHWPHRKQAAECVITMGVRALPALLKPCLSQQEHIRFWSRKVLAEIGGPKAERFVTTLDALTPEEQSRVIDCLSEIPGHELIGLLSQPPLQAEAQALGTKPAVDAPAVPPPPPRSALAPVTPPESTVTPLAAEPDARSAQVRPNPPARPTATMRILRQDIAVLMDSLLAKAIELKATDLLLKSGHPAMALCENGPVELGTRMITGEELDSACRIVLGRTWSGTVDSPIQQCFDLATAGRCRARVFKEEATLCLQLRQIGLRPPRLREIRAETLLQGIPELRDGLVLLGGAPGSGKSWTASALLDAINNSRCTLIATVESPIEHINFPRPNFISQIEVPGEFPTMAEGLRAACNSGAGVIYLSSVPDAQTAMLALEEAATCSLVIATVQSTDAIDAIRQFAKLAGEVSPKALGLLASALRASIAQIPARSGDESFVAVREILTGVPRVHQLLALGRIDELAEILRMQPPISGIQSQETAVHELRARGVLLSSYVLPTRAGQSFPSPG
jgi:twitching motility protein PilT